MGRKKQTEKKAEKAASAPEAAASATASDEGTTAVVVQALGLALVAEIARAISTWNILLGFMGQDVHRLGVAAVLRLGSWSCDKWREALTVPAYVDVYKDRVAVVVRMGALGALLAIYKGVV
eukprot:4557652-Prymnesium_polylepis.1